MLQQALDKHQEPFMMGMANQVATVILHQQYPALLYFALWQRTAS